MDIFEFDQEDKEFLEQFVECVNFSVSTCKLKSIQFLPMLPTIMRLDLANNRLNGQNLNILNQYKTLESLKLANNLIRNFTYLQSLSSLESLISLDLSANPVTEVNDYREQIFELLPNLEVLDGLDKEGNEVASENMSQEMEDYDVGDKEDGGDLMSDE